MHFLQRAVSHEPAHHGVEMMTVIIIGDEDIDNDGYDDGWR